MISRNDFLPKFNALTAEQRAALAKSVLDYQTDTLPKVESAPEPWTADTVAMFDEGLILISTMFKAREFCVAAYAYRQASKRLNGFRALFLNLQDTLIKSGDIKEVVGSGTSVTKQRRLISDPRRVLKKAELITTFVEADRFPLGDLQRSQEASEATGELRSSLNSVSDHSRPRHLDQYIGCLSPEMQKEASHISDLYLQFADTARKLEDICNNPKSHKQDRAYHACLLCEIEDKISNLWRRIDYDYAKQTGKEISVDYEEYLSAETKALYDEQRDRALGEHTKIEIEMMADSDPAKEPARRARIERDKKFLRRNDRQQSDEQKENLLLAAQELHEWGFVITPTQVENCKFYGVDIPQEWQELSPEEQAEKDAEREEKRRAAELRRNEKRKAERKAAREAREAQEAADLAEAAAPYEQMAEGTSLI